MTSLHPLHEYIERLYVNKNQCAAKLKVTPMTVHNWIHKSPRNMLKFAPEIVAEANTTHFELCSEVLAQERWLADHHYLGNE